MAHGAGLIVSFARVCSRYPVDRKVLLVRNHHVGQVVLQSLARCGGGWLNLRAMTPAELAGEGLAAADELALEGVVIEAYQETKRAFFPGPAAVGIDRGGSKGDHGAANCDGHAVAAARDEIVEGMRSRGDARTVHGGIAAGRAAR